MDPPGFFCRGHYATRTYKTKIVIMKTIEHRDHEKEKNTTLSPDIHLNKENPAGRNEKTPDIQEILVRKPVGRTFFLVTFWIRHLFLFLIYFFLCVVGNFPMPPTSGAPILSTFTMRQVQMGRREEKGKKTTQINMLAGRRSIFFIFFFCVSISSAICPAFQVTILLFSCLNYW